MEQEIERPNKIHCLFIDVDHKEVKKVEASLYSSAPGSLWDLMQAKMLEPANFYIANGDTLLCDEEAIYTKKKFFQIKDHIYKGSAVIVFDDGEDYTDCKSALEEIQSIVSFPDLPDDLEPQPSMIIFEE